MRNVEDKNYLKKLLDGGLHSKDLEFGSCGKEGICAFVGDS